MCTLLHNAYGSESLLLAIKTLDDLHNEDSNNRDENCRRSIGVDLRETVIKLMQKNLATLRATESQACIRPPLGAPLRAPCGVVSWVAWLVSWVSLLLPSVGLLALRVDLPLVALPSLRAGRHALRVGSPRE